MANLTVYDRDTLIPADRRLAGLVYFVGGHSALTRNDWVALCLTNQEILLCDRSGPVANIHLSEISRPPFVTTIEDMVINLPTSTGRQAVRPHLPYGVAVPYLRAQSALEDQLVVYVAYRSVAQRWVNEINAAIDLFHRRNMELSEPREG